METNPVGQQPGPNQAAAPTDGPAAAASHRTAPAQGPSPLSRRSVQWALFGILLILLLGGFAVSAVLTIYPPGQPLERSQVLPEKEWSEFHPPGGGCSVLQPGPPAWVLHTPHGVRYWWQRKKEHCEFLLICPPAEDPHFGGVPELLAIDRQQLLRTFQGTRVSRDESTTVAGLPGREVEVRGPSDQLFVIRAFVVGQGPTKRLYELQVGGVGIRPDAGDAARFFDSFRLERPGKPPGRPKQS
jgi:hypothetical protein